MVKLGTQVRDRVTGYEGTAMSRTTYMNGCVRVGIQAPGLFEGKILEEVWCDEGQVDDAKTGEPVTTAGEDRAQPSGPGSRPPALSTPRQY